MSEYIHGAKLHEKAIGWFLCGMVLFFPLLPAAGGYQKMSLWAAGIFAGAVILLLVLLLVLPAELAVTGSGPLKELWRPLQRLGPVRVLLLLYLGWSFLSALVSTQPGVFIGLGRREGFLMIFCYIFLFWAVASYGHWQDRFLDLLGVVLLINAALGLLQYGGMNPLGLFPEGTGYHDAFVLYNGAFMGTLGNIDVLSAFLCLTVPLFYGAYYVQGLVRRLVPLAAGCFLLSLADVDSGAVGLGLMLVLTLPLFFCRADRRSRVLIAAGVMAVAAGLGKCLFADRHTALTLSPDIAALSLIVVGAGLLLLGGLLRRHGSGADEMHTRKSFFRLLLVIFLLGLLGVGAVWALPSLPGFLGELHEILHGNFDPSFGSGRLRIWDAVLGLIAQEPLFGGGPDTLVARMPFTFSRYIESAGQTVEAVIDTAHNDFLNIAVNQGIPAMLFYLGALGAWLMRALRHLKTTPALWILLPGIVAYLIQSCFTFSICSVSALFWIILALGEGLIYEAEHKTRKEKIKT